MKNQQEKDAAEIQKMKSENETNIVENLNRFAIEKCDENINLPEAAKRKLNDETEKFRRDDSSSNFDFGELSQFIKAKKKKEAEQKLKINLQKL